MEKLENRLETLFLISQETEIDVFEVFKQKYEAIRDHYNFDNVEMNRYWLPYQHKRLEELKNA